MGASQDESGGTVNHGTRRIVCVHEATSPITHMARTEGNEAMVMREPVITPRGVAYVPSLSGNAMRHRLIREPGMLWLAEQYGLTGKLTLPQLNFLLHGGNLTEGGGRENTARIADFQRLFPLGRLLGGCLPDQILSGVLKVGRGTLVCEENRDKLNHMLGGGLLPDRLRPAESFVSGYQYTRGDAAKSAGRFLKADSPIAESSNLMIFSGQAVTRGAMFASEFILDDRSHELGALLWSLSLWQSQGGTIGGQASRGHGMLATSVVSDDGIDVDGLTAAYRDYAVSVKDDAVAWINGVFASKAEKPAKGAKGKAALLPVEDE